MFNEKLKVIYYHNTLLFCIVVNLGSGFIQVTNKFLAARFDEYGAFFLVYSLAFIIAGIRLFIRPFSRGQFKTASIFKKPSVLVLYLVVILTGHVLAPLFYFSALNLTAIYTQSFIYLLYPLTITLVSKRLFREGIGALGSAGILLLFFSYAVYINHLLTDQTVNMAGVFFLFMSVVFLIVQKLAHKKLLLITEGFSDMWLSLWGLLASAVTAMLFLLKMRQGFIFHFFSSPSVWGDEWRLFVFLAVSLAIVYLFQHYLRNNFLRRLPLIKIFPFYALVPVSTAVFSHIFYRFVPEVYPYQPLDFTVLFCLLAMLLAGGLLFLDHRREAFPYHLTKKVLGVSGAVFLVVYVFGGRFLAPAVSTINRSLLKGMMPQDVIEAVVDNRYGKVKEVLALDCVKIADSRSDSGLQGSCGYIFNTSKGIFSIAVSECSTCISSDLRVKSFRKFGSVECFSPIEGGRKVCVSYRKPLAVYEKFYMGVNTETGKILAVKHLGPEIAALYRKVIWEKKKFRGNLALSAEKLITGEIYRSENGDYYTLMPFISGRDFQRYFNFNYHEAAEKGAFDLRPKAVHLIEKVLEVGDLAKLFYRMGLYNQDIYEGNLMIRHKDLAMVMLDFDCMMPLAPVHDSSYNFAEIFSLFYPYIYESFTVIDVPERMMPLIMSDDIRVNDWINIQMETIRRKIATGSYFSDEVRDRVYRNNDIDDFDILGWIQELGEGDGYKKEIDVKGTVTPVIMIAAMDRFLADIKKILAAVKGEGMEDVKPPPEGREEVLTFDPQTTEYFY